MLGLIKKVITINQNIDNAIEFYEIAKSGFVGTFPYDRLEVTYRRKKEVEKEIKVLDKAINVFNKLPRYADTVKKYQTQLGKP